MTQEDQPKIKIRIESLSDLVFGLALSIGSIQLLSNQVHNLTDIVVNVLYFGFSFMILVFTWFGYSRTMTVLPAETRNALWINVVMLFLVAIEPYLFYVLVSSPTNDFAKFASIPYAINVGALFLTQAGLSRLVVVEDRQSKIEHKLHPAIIARSRRIFISEVIVGILYLVSALPLSILRVPKPIGYSRFIIWYSSFGIFFVSRGAVRRSKRKEKISSVESNPSSQSAS